MTFTIPDGVRRVVSEINAEDEARRYREESDAKFKRLRDTPMVQLGPDEPLPPGPLKRPDYMRKGGYDTPDLERPSTPTQAFVPQEGDPLFNRFEQDRQYSSLGPSPALTARDLEGDPQPDQGFAINGTGGPENGPLSEATIIDLKQQRDDRAAAGVRSALAQQPGTPDDAARDIETARELGVNRGEVSANRQSYEFAKTAKNIDALTSSAPKLRTWLDQARENLEVSHDDLQNLSWWESIGSMLYNTPGAIASGTVGIGESLAGFGQGVTDLTDEWFRSKPSPFIAVQMGQRGEDLRKLTQQGDKPKDPNAPLSQVGSALETARKAAKDVKIAIRPKGRNDFESGYYSGIESLTQNVPLIAASVVTGNPEIAMAGMSSLTAGEAYSRATDERPDLSVAARVGFALREGGIEFLTEVVPTSMIVEGILKGTVKSMITEGVKSRLAEHLGEQAATALQDLDEWLTLKPEGTWEQYLNDRPSAAMQTFVATLVGTEGQMAAGKAADVAFNRISEQAQQKRTDQLSATFDAMAQGAADSKLLNRLPDKYREAVAAVTKDGPLESVRVAPEAFTELAQSANVTTDQLAQAFRIDPADMNASIASGEDVVIPAGNYAAALKTAKKEIGVSGETIHGALSPNMRLRADDFTVKEREAMKSVFEAEQKAQVEAGNVDQAFADSADRVREVIREQVAGLGIFNTEAANTQASIIGEMVTTLAERTGQDPEALWKEQGFDIVTSLTGQEDAGSLDQGLQRQAIQVDDETVLAASEKLPPHEFEVWKEAIKGGSNDEVTDRLNANRDGDHLMEPKDVARILSRVREKGFEVQKLRTGPALSAETQKIIDLKARGLDNAEIGRQLFPHLSVKERTKKARVASNNNWKAVEARRQELSLAQEKRGSFTPRAMGRSTIRLFESSNLSTLVHEAAHWYLDTLWRMANIPAQTTAPTMTVREGSVLTAEEMSAILNPQDMVHPFVMEQIAAILEWQGKSPNWTAMFDDQGNFTQEGRDIQEAFAESFEAYLREGKAPTSALRSVFASFKAWLLRIYKSVTSIGSRVKLNDEIRQVFDRMLATDEAIKAQTSTMTRDAEAMAKALLEKGVITERQVEKTRERLLAAKERAEAELMARLMEDYERNQKAWWRDEERQTRREVQSEIDERPEQRAYAWLSGKGWRATREGLVEEAANMADAMASLEQYDEALAFSRYYEPDANDENLKRLQERMRADGVDPVIMLFKAPNGRIIAFQGSAAGYSHDLAREIMGLGDLKLQHGIYDPRKGLAGMQGIDWYATTGTQDTLSSPELAQFAPRSAAGAPLHSLMRATLMDIGGESKEDIWRETGWAQTKFGDWVWEIPGKPQFNFNPETKAQSGRLDQLIEWPELFEAMPILRTVYLKASTGAQSGRFEGAQPVTFPSGETRIVPLINARGSVAGSNTLMETIQHEIQHAIQAFGGFASGGASNRVEFYRGTKMFESEVARLRKLDAKLLELASAEGSGSILFEPMDEVTLETNAALNVYLHNHGEWQARQVEWRSRMPAEWRWANPPGTEVPGTQENVDERHTWATLDELRAAGAVQRSGDESANPAVRLARTLAGNQEPAAQGAGEAVGQDNGGGTGSGELAQRVAPAERAAEIQRVLAYFEANPEAARNVALSAIMAVTDASAQGVDIARRQFRERVSPEQAKRLAAIDAGMSLVQDWLIGHPNAFATMRVGEIARAVGVPVEAVQRVKAEEQGSLSQLSDAGVAAIRQFMATPLQNAHILVDKYEVYLRKGRRVDERGELVTTLDLASIQRTDSENASFEIGRAPNEKPGDFRELVARLEQEARDNGLDAVYIENVFNEFLPDVFRRYGYTQMPGGFPHSFIKHVDGGSLSQSSLDMSEAGRMQRAREQGFDVETPWFHASKTPLEDFNASKGQLGLHVGTKEAAEHMASGTQSRAYNAKSDWPISSVVTRGNYAKVPDLGNWDWSSYQLARDGTFAKRGASELEFDPRFNDMWKALDDFAATRPSFQQWQDRVQSEAAKRGLAGWEYTNRAEAAGSTSRIIMDKGAVRKSDASFDPAQSGSSKLLDSFGATPETLGVAALGGAGGAAYAQDDNKDGVIDLSERLKYAAGGAFGTTVASGMVRQVGRALGPPKAAARSVESGAVRSFTARDGTQYAVHIDDAGHVSFNANSGPKAPRNALKDEFKPTGKSSLAEANEVFAGVEKAIRDDIAETGRSRYVLNGRTPRQRELYAQMAQRKQPPEGYRWEVSDKGVALRKTTEAPVSRDIDMTPDGYERTTQIGNAKLTYAVQPDGAMTIEMIDVPPAARGKGEAGAALDKLLAEADANGSTVYLDPKPVGQGGLTAAQLQDFYRKRGFTKQQGSPGLVRSPMDAKDPGRAARKPEAVPATPIRGELPDGGRSISIGRIGNQDLTGALYSDPTEGLSFHPNYPASEWNDLGDAAATKLGKAPSTLKRMITPEGGPGLLRMTTKKTGVPKWSERNVGQIAEEHAPAIDEAVRNRFIGLVKSNPNAPKYSLELDPKITSQDTRKALIKLARETDRVFVEVPDDTISLIDRNVFNQTRGRYRRAYTRFEEPGLPPIRTTQNSFGFGGSKPPGNKMGPPKRKFSPKVVAEVDRLKTRMGPPTYDNGRPMNARAMIEANAAKSPGSRVSAMAATDNAPIMFSAAARAQPPLRKNVIGRVPQDKTSFTPHLQSALSAASGYPSTAPAKSMLKFRAVQAGNATKAASKAQRAENAAYDKGWRGDDIRPRVETRISAERAKRDAVQRLQEAQIPLEDAAQVQAQVRARIGEIQKELNARPEMRDFSPREREEMAQLLFEEEYAQTLDDALSGRAPLVARSPQALALKVAAAGGVASVAGLGLIIADTKTKEGRRLVDGPETFKDGPWDFPDPVEVRQMQRTLKEIKRPNGHPYYTGAIDGDYGEGMTTAVMLFQNDLGLSHGALTRKMLTKRTLDELRARYQ